MIGAGWLRVVSSVHEGDLPGNFFLEAKVGGLFIPEGEGGRYHVHGLDAMHDPSRDPCREIGD